MIGRREKSRKQRSNDHASHCGTGTMFSLGGGEAKKGEGMKKVLIFLHYASGFFFLKEKQYVISLLQSFSLNCHSHLPKKKKSQK